MFESGKQTLSSILIFRLFVLIFPTLYMLAIMHLCMSLTRLLARPPLLSFFAYLSLENVLKLTMSLEATAQMPNHTPRWGLLTLIVSSLVVEVRPTVCARKVRLLRFSNLNTFLWAFWVRPMLNISNNHNDDSNQTHVYISITISYHNNGKRKPRSWFSKVYYI